MKHYLSTWMHFSGIPVVYCVELLYCHRPLSRPFCKVSRLQTGTVEGSIRHVLLLDHLRNVYEAIRCESAALEISTVLLNLSYAELWFAS